MAVMRFEDHNPLVSRESETNSRPQVSVVIPAYNAATYIAGTLDSVFAQTYTEFEVIVVNDGSSDTEALERELKPYFSRIHYFKQANRGPSAARNLGIREARGQYIALLDADDFWLPQHLANQIQRLTRNQELGLVYANALHLRGDALTGTAFELVPQSGVVNIESLLSEQCTVNTSSVVVLRSALLQAGLFDETMFHCEDFDLWLRLAGMGVSIEYDREIHVGHRLGSGLAASAELMKKGRVRAYEKFAASSAIRDSERSIIASKLKILELEIHLELAKQRLLMGSYREALTEVRLARSIAGERRLQWAELGLLCFPSGLRWLYRIYTQQLQRYKQRQEKQFVKEVPVAGELLAAKTFSPHRAPRQDTRAAVPGKIAP
jgi:glycosyltransferase involved in cell wall biosynthesis